MSVKKFIYHFDQNKYQGYRRIIEKDNFVSFKKIHYEGFKITYETDNEILFEIDSQSLRKLKLLKINENKLNSNERRLIALLDRAKDAQNSEFGYNYSLYWNYKNYNYENYYENEINQLKKEQKKNLKAQANKFNQKLKNYENKSRIRK